VLFKKLFTKDCHYFFARGDKLLLEERYADARNAFSEALQKMEDAGIEDGALKASIHDKLAECGNRLALLNLAEAEHAIKSGEQKKAEDHLQLVLVLAEDVTLREKAEIIIKMLAVDAPVGTPPTGKNACAGCAEHSDKTSQDSHVSDEQLATADRFELYVQTLPGDLPERYAGLGEKFAYGYLLNRDGDGESALTIFSELSAEEQSDILDYEMALIYYRAGNLSECERLLRRSISSNDMNPLSYFGLVQLFGETGRIAEAIPFLDRMVEKKLVPEQAHMMLGDAYLLLDDENSAVASYSEVLASPRHAREAAERLIPLLEKAGRREDAVILFKRYAKGCC
jgi:predicted negative regulator of RcsB-dependent stress response